MLKKKKRQNSKNKKKKQKNREESNHLLFSTVLQKLSEGPQSASLLHNVSLES